MGLAGGSAPPGKEGDLPQGQRMAEVLRSKLSAQRAAAAERNPAGAPSADLAHDGAAGQKIEVAPCLCANCMRWPALQLEYEERLRARMAQELRTTLWPVVEAVSSRCDALEHNAAEQRSRQEKFDQEQQRLGEQVQEHRSQLEQQMSLARRLEGSADRLAGDLAATRSSLQKLEEQCTASHASLRENIATSVAGMESLALREVSQLEGRIFSELERLSEQVSKSGRVERALEEGLAQLAEQIYKKAHVDQVVDELRRSASLLAPRVQQALDDAQVAMERSSAAGKAAEDAANAAAEASSLGHVAKRHSAKVQGDVELLAGEVRSCHEAGALIGRRQEEAQVMIQRFETRFFGLEESLFRNPPGMKEIEALLPRVGYLESKFNDVAAEVERKVSREISTAIAQSDRAARALKDEAEGRWREVEVRAEGWAEACRRQAESAKGDMHEQAQLCIASMDRNVGSLKVETEQSLRRLREESFDAASALRLEAQRACEEARSASGRAASAQELASAASHAAESAKVAVKEEVRIASSSLESRMQRLLDEAQATFERVKAAGRTAEEAARAAADSFAGPELQELRALASRALSSAQASERQGAAAEQSSKEAAGVVELVVGHLQRLESQQSTALAEARRGLGEAQVSSVQAVAAAKMAGEATQVAQEAKASVQLAGTRIDKLELKETLSGAAAAAARQIAEAPDAGSQVSQLRADFVQLQQETSRMNQRISAAGQMAEEAMTRAQAAPQVQVVESADPSLIALLRADVARVQQEAGRVSRQVSTAGQLAEEAMAMAGKTAASEAQLSELRACLGHSIQEAKVLAEQVSAAGQVAEEAMSLAQESTARLKMLESKEVAVEPLRRLAGELRAETRGGLKALEAWVRDLEGQLRAVVGSSGYR